MGKRYRGRQRLAQHNPERREQPLITTPTHSDAKAPTDLSCSIKAGILGMIHISAETVTRQLQVSLPLSAVSLYPLLSPFLSLSVSVSPASLSMCLCFAMSSCTHLPDHVALCVCMLVSVFVSASYSVFLSFFLLSAENRVPESKDWDTLTFPSRECATPQSWRCLCCLPCSRGLVLLEWKAWPTRPHHFLHFHDVQREVYSTSFSLAVPLGHEVLGM